MSTKSITDHQVLMAARDGNVHNGFAHGCLVATTDQHEEVCWRALERAEGRGLVNVYGPSGRGAMLTPLGIDMLDLLDRLDRVVDYIKDGECYTLTLEALETAFPAGVADARRWCEQRGLWLDRASVWMRPLKVPRYFLIGRGARGARPISATTPAAAV